MSATFDIDGTLIVKGTRPNDKVIGLCNASPESYVVTGREENTRDETAALLSKFGIRYRGLLMNSLGPEKSDQIKSKKANMTKLLSHGPVELAVDEDKTVRSMYKTLGVQKVVGPSG